MKKTDKEYHIRLLKISDKEKSQKPSEEKKRH